MTIHPTPEEKPTNRDGQLSLRQEKLVGGYRGIAYKLVLVLMILSIVYSSLGWWGAVITFSLLTTYFYIDVLHGARATLRRAEIEVKFISGSITRHKVEIQDAATNYSLLISGIAFSIPAAAYHTLPEEAVSGHVYYIEDREYLFHELTV